MDKKKNKAPFPIDAVRDSSEKGNADFKDEKGNADFKRKKGGFADAVKNVKAAKGKKKPSKKKGK